jgi:hypothetical protein
MKFRFPKSSIFCVVVLVAAYSIFWNADSVTANVPIIPGRELLLNVVDESTGSVLSDVTFIINIKYDPPLDDSSHSYTQKEWGVSPFRLPIVLPGVASQAVIAVTKDGFVGGGELEIDWAFFHNAIAPSREGGVDEILLEHTFVLEQQESVSESLSPPESTAHIRKGLFISVVDEQGQVIQEGDVERLVEYQDFPERNHMYITDLSFVLDNENGVLPLDPPPGHIPAIVSVRVVTLAGETSDTLVIKNDEYWDAMLGSNEDFIATHEFVIGKTGVTMVKFGVEEEAVEQESEQKLPSSIATTESTDVPPVEKRGLTLVQIAGINILLLIIAVVTYVFWKKKRSAGVVHTKS